MIHHGDSKTLKIFKRFLKPRFGGGSKTPLFKTPENTLIRGVQKPQKREKRAINRYQNW